MIFRPLSALPLSRRQTQTSALRDALSTTHFPLRLSSCLHNRHQDASCDSRPSSLGNVSTPRFYAQSRSHPRHREPPTEERMAICAAVTIIPREGDFFEQGHKPEEIELRLRVVWRLSGLMLMSVHLHLLVKTRGCSLMVVFGLGSSTSTWS